MHMSVHTFIGALTDGTHVASAPVNEASIRVHIRLTAIASDRPTTAMVHYMKGVLREGGRGRCREINHRQRSSIEHYLILWHICKGLYDQPHGDFAAVQHVLGARDSVHSGSHEARAGIACGRGPHDGQALTVYRVRVCYLPSSRTWKSVVTRGGAMPRVEVQ